MTDNVGKIKFPNEIDNDDNLFLVHDNLKLKLAIDYTPGDTSILVSGDDAVFNQFPPTGIITLTEQYSEPDDRALSFFYESKGDLSFNEISILPEFKDCKKIADLTTVTMNVFNKHHNSLKDALIAAQNFIGVEGELDKAPFGDTLEGRLNFLKKLVYTPKAWFSLDNRIGIVPFCIKFKDESFRLGNSDVEYYWNFGDGVEFENSPSSHVISATDIVPETNISTTPIKVLDQDGGEIIKCYNEPGVYDVRLQVKNKYGEDSVTFKGLVIAKVEAPELAKLKLTPRSTQKIYNNPLKIRTKTGIFVDVELENGEDLDNPGYSLRGEKLDDNNDPIDPIIEYTWDIADDVEHSNLPITKALFSVGGLYDIAVRVDTKFNSYRITKEDNIIDVIEDVNLWMWNFSEYNENSSGVIKGYEFGLISETFKTLGNQSLNINRDNSFLNNLGQTSFDEGTELRAKNEFDRNVNFTRRGNLNSGNNGVSLLMYSSGGVLNNQTIKVNQYNGFSDVYSNIDDINNKTWNWVALNSTDNTYFLLGSGEEFASANENPNVPELQKFNLSALVATSPQTLTSGYFENGADDLLKNISSFDENGIPTNGYFSTYRSAWKDNTGYILKNSGVNDFFRLSNFYKTNGTLINNVNSITKINDLVGRTVVEGQMVPMNSGMFVFNNSGQVSAWNINSNVWETLRQSSTTLAFRSLQDSNISSFDNEANTLLASSDGDSVAYLSFDYSQSAFIKFNLTNKTFSSAGGRPSGKQFMMGIF